MFIKDFVPLPTLRIHSTGGSAKQAHPHTPESHLYRDCSGAAKTVNKFVPIEITYPGSGNFSKLMYDGLGRNAKIEETVSGTLASTKQLVWCADNRCEERDGSGNVTKQFFTRGQRNGSSNYIYTTDHLGSIREMTDSGGAIQAQYAFDPYGRTTRVQGAQTADFQYAGYYNHAPSALNLTRTRAFNSVYGRWISRDPIYELGGVNLYAYVAGNPINRLDPNGLGTECCQIDWNKVREAANWGTVTGAAVGGYIGWGGGAAGGAIAGGGIGAVPGSAAGAYGGAAAGAAIGGFGAGGASIASQMAGNMMSSGAGSSGAGAGAGATSGAINCKPDPCDPHPSGIPTYAACIDYCNKHCPPTNLGNAKCRSKCLRYFGGGNGGGSDLPPVRPR